MIKRGQVYRKYWQYGAASTNSDPIIIRVLGFITPEAKYVPINKASYIRYYFIHCDRRLTADVPIMNFELDYRLEPT